jgi:hypothetical protein
MEAGTTLRRTPRAVYRELADEEGGVVLHLDTAAYHGLNSVGGLIWELLEDERTFGSLVSELSARLEDPPSVMEHEVAVFLSALEERGLILTGETPDG